MERQSQIKSVETAPIYFKQFTSYHHHNHEQKSTPDPSEQWSMFKILRSSQSLIDAAVEKNYPEEEVIQLISLAQAYREHKHFGESYQTLLQAKMTVEKLLLSCPIPRGMYQIAILLFSTNSCNSRASTC